MKIGIFRGFWPYSQKVFSCDQTALRTLLSVRPSVRLSVCPSHLFFYVPIIVSSWNSQELLPWTKVMSMQKVKVKGQSHKCLKKFYVLYHSSNQNVFENNYISQGHKYFVVDVTWTLFHIYMFLVVLAVHIYYFTFSWLSISWQVFLFMALHVTEYNSCCEHCLG